MPLNMVAGLVLRGPHSERYNRDSHALEDICDQVVHLLKLMLKRPSMSVGDIESTTFCEFITSMQAVCLVYRLSSGPIWAEGTMFLELRTIFTCCPDSGSQLSVMRIFLRLKNFRLLRCATSCTACFVPWARQLNVASQSRLQSDC